MRLSLILFFVCAAACSEDSQDAEFCTTAACATDPCAAGCAFAAPGSQQCTTALPGRVAVASARACPAFCGLQTENPVGCLRYHSELPACSGDCVIYSAECWPADPVADYKTGGAICSSGSCFGGAGFVTEDGGVECHTDQGSPPDLSHD